MKKIFKTIGYGLSVPFVCLALLFSLLFIKPKAKKYIKDPNSIFLQERLKTVYKVAKKILYIRRVEIDAENMERIPTKQMLYVANHKSTLDPMVLFCVLYEQGKLGPISFICKNELSKHWYTRCAIQLIDGIFIQRDNGRSVLECFQKQMENVKKGYSIMVYPEGTRVPGDEFKEFNSTTLKVAFQNFIAIQPIVTYGTDKKRKAFDTRKVYISALKTVQPNNFINIRQEQLMSTIKNEIIDKYIELKLKSTGANK